jgi:hypothetical protein
MGGRLWVFGLIPDFVLSCHEHNLKPTLSNYIYHKNEIGKPPEKDSPF